MNVSPNPTPINPSEITLGESLLHVSWVKVSYAIWQGKNVVVKQLRLTEKGDPTLEDCRREATLLHDSRHPNVVGLYGVSDKSTEYWLVLERVAKGALEQVLSREELPWETRFCIANDMTSGLNYLHGKGLLHRDIKSSNILIDENNRAKLADFGIAKPEEETSTKTHTQGTWKMYTRCEESWNKWQMMVGGLAPRLTLGLTPGGDLRVHYYRGVIVHVGVAAARRF